MDTTSFSLINAVTVNIKEAFLNELRDEARKLVKHNIIGVRRLRTFTGCVSHVANLLFGWRASMDSSWAATSTAEKKQTAKRSRAPRGMVWGKQVRKSIRWILRFLEQHHGPLSRAWHMDDFRSSPLCVIISVDAPPWGIGGVLQVEGRIVAYLLS